MNKHKFISFLFLFISFFSYSQGNSKTIVSIQGENFFINGRTTYRGAVWNNINMEGLLLNSRMVQGIFDDLNPATRELFIYPDTKKWDADRNTNEFVSSMEEWYQHGLLAFTINLQGGSPTGYGNKGWINSAFDNSGNLREDYMSRLDKILKKADDLGMVVILGYFYQGQDQNIRDENAVINAVDRATAWLLGKGYKNVMVEINNECNTSYDHEILKPARVHELINRVKSKNKNGYRLLVSTSYGGNVIPLPNVAEASDFLLLHGNGVTDPDRITQMVEETRKIKGYRAMPLLFNEDDHYDFKKSNNNFASAVKAHASWGFFDYRRQDEPYQDGFQSVPVDWRISSTRKKEFFGLMREMTKIGVYQKAASYKIEMLNLQSIIRKHFYDRATGYYKEFPVISPGHKPYSYLWPLCAMLQANNEIEVAKAGKNLVDSVLSVIKDYYDPSPPKAGYASYIMKLKGGDRFYDDNQWIGITAMDRYSRLKNKSDLQLGKLIYDYMMTGYDTVLTGGIYWQENKKTSKNTCSNGPGIVLALQLYKATKLKPYLDTALMIYKWTNEKLQAPNKLFYDNINIASQRIGRRQYTYNTGTMLQSNIYLYEITGDRKYLNEAISIADSSMKYFYGNKKFTDNYWFNAVLLRGYQHLLKHHPDTKYIIAFKGCLDEALLNQRNAEGLFVQANKVQDLVAHGGMLEILARFAVMEGKYKL